MSESVWAEMHLLLPPSWTRADILTSPCTNLFEQVVLNLVEAFWNSGDTDVEMYDLDKAIIHLEGDLNYGSEAIKQELVALEGMHVPYRLVEDSGPDWSGTWHLFDGFTLWRGLWDNTAGPTLDADDLRSIAYSEDDAEKYYQIVEYYTNANRDLSSFSIDHLRGTNPPPQGDQHEDEDNPVPMVP